MDDAAFLGYCEIHARTPRCLFSRAQVDRLRAPCRREPIAWDGTYPAWLSLGSAVIDPAVAEARGLGPGSSVQPFAVVES